MSQPVEPRILRITPAAVNVTDCEKAEVFFRSVLGFTVTGRTRSEDGDYYTVALAAPGGAAPIKLVCEGVAAASRRGEPTLVMASVEHLNLLVDLLRKRGVEFEELPRASEIPIRFARFHGPESLIIELVERAAELR